MDPHQDYKYQFGIQLNFIVGESSNHETERDGNISLWNRTTNRPLLLITSCHSEGQNEIPSKELNSQSSKTCPEESQNPLANRTHSHFPFMKTYFVYLLAKQNKSAVYRRNGKHSLFQISASE